MREVKMSKKLYRSKKSKILGGVCGGIAEYLDTDPTIIRLVWLILAVATDFFGGVFFILYFAAWIIVPVRPDVEETETPVTPEKNRNLVFLIGAGLVIYGIVKIMEKALGSLDIHPMLFGLSLSAFFWPAAFIIAGLLVILVLGRKNK
jgi:phage shock protein C